MIGFYIKCNNGLKWIKKPKKIPQALRDALHDLVPFVQFLKSEKHPWRSVTKSNTPP